MRSMLRCSLATIALAVFSLAVASPATAQCNHCGPADECFEFHWDNCGVGGAGLDWTGECTAGCDNQDCANHSGSCLAAMDFDQALHLVGNGEWQSLARSALAREVEFDFERGVLYVRSCADEQIIGQIPLASEGSFQLAAAIERRRLALLAELIQ